MADPAPESVWQYNPSFALAVLASILYGILFLAIFYLTFIKYRSWYFTCVVVGAAIEVAGYGLRCYSVKNPTEVAPFATTLSLIVVAPILVSAGNYLLLARLIRSVLPFHPRRDRIFPGLPAHLITRVFVVSDILSGMVQSSGTGIASGDNWTGPNRDIGIYILIGGLALQAASFMVYMALLGRFHYLAGAKGEAMDGGGIGGAGLAPAGWRRLVKTIYVSSAAIMIRCIYRVAEFAEGIEGYSFRNEWLFWVFEAVPMLVAISAFCFCHPASVLGRDAGKRVASGDEEDGEELTTSRRRRRHRKH